MSKQISQKSNDNKTKEVKTEKTVQKDVKSDSKMGAVRFLQLHPQNYMTKSLVMAEYQNVVMRESEWLIKLSELLHKKITK